MTTDLTKSFEQRVRELKFPGNAKGGSSPHYVGFIECRRMVIPIAAEADQALASRWILCSERMPEPETQCLVTVSGDGGPTRTDKDMFNEKGRWFRHSKSHIVAWQPLPAPWRPEEEGSSK